jgi:hypothetical protein
MNYSRKQSENEKRKERRLRCRQCYEDNDWHVNPTGPTPYEDWEDEADSYRNEITSVLAKHPGAKLWYRHDARRQQEPITDEDLALALYAVIRVGRRGISYGQMQSCFKRWGISCHRAKAGRLFALLREWGMIVKTGGHRSGVHGTKYERPKPPPPDITSIEDWLG